MSQLLFLLYTKSLANTLPNNNVNALFADDVSVLATAKHKEQAEKEAQQAVTIVAKWANTHKL